MKCPRLLPITLVALTGLAGCGKDTVADVLVAHRGFTKLAFADALRTEVADAFAIDPAYLTQRETKEHPISALALDRCLDPVFVERMAAVLKNACLSPQLLTVPRSPRQIMQWWGTEYRRAQRSDYWVDKAHDEIAALQMCGRERFVISDCRFQNEAAFVRRMEGSIWQVVRPSITPLADAHVSETEGAQFLPDVLLGNTHGIDHLRLQALAACNRLTLAEAA
jgi:hypothetical protein